MERSEAKRSWFIDRRVVKRSDVLMSLVTLAPFPSRVVVPDSSQ